MIQYDEEDDAVRRDRICIICGEVYHGFGNNADPAAQGLACDDCNMTVVLPSRLPKGFVIVS
jgi:hypothetical protein